MFGGVHNQSTKIVGLQEEKMFSSYEVQERYQNLARTAELTAAYKRDTPRAISVHPTLSDHLLTWKAYLQRMVRFLSGHKSIS